MRAAVLRTLSRICLWNRMLCEKVASNGYREFLLNFNRTSLRLARTTLSHFIMYKG